MDLFDPSQLGFNPMQIVHPTPTSFIDNAGELRDIFAAIFPDLGDIQLDRIRQAIKRSYQESGWNAAQPPGGASNDAGQNGPGLCRSAELPRLCSGKLPTTWKEEEGSFFQVVRFGI